MYQEQSTISARNTASLFVSSLIPFIIGNMLIVTLPLLATRLGANETMIGLFMASTFLAVTVGSVTAGRFANSQQKGVSLLVASGIANGLILELVGLVGHFEIFVVMAWLSMFLIGFGQTTINILTGHIAAASERGRVFGLIGLTFGLGLLIGGFIAGPIVDHFGFTTFFFASSMLFFVQPLAALNIRVPNFATQKSEGSKIPSSGRRLQRRFYLLFLASLLAFIAQFVGVLGRQLVMDEMGFSITMISAALAISGLCVTPMTLLVGWFSDRINRIALLSLTYGLTFLGLFVMIGADDGFRFGLSAALITSVNAGSAVGWAYVTDILPRASLSRGLSLYNSTVWLGAVIGFAFAGRAIQLIGASATFMIAAILAAASVVLVLPLMSMKKRASEVDSAASNHLSVQFLVRKPDVADFATMTGDTNREIFDVNLVDFVFLSCTDSSENDDPRLSIETHDSSANHSALKYGVIRRMGDKLYFEGFADNGRIRVNSIELEPHIFYPLRSGDEIKLGKLGVIIRYDEPVD